MAGPAQHHLKGRGRSPRPGSSLRLDLDSTVAGAADATGSHSPTAVSPDNTVRLATSSTYRGFLTRGLAPDEAANLTAFMCGIPVADVRWSLRQVNQLLFLRALAQKGRFGSGDGGRARTH